MHVRKITGLGLMLALIFILSMLEQALPPLPFLPPHMRLGLSNVVTMYCVFFVGKKEAVLLMLVKSGFVFVTRGVLAALLSASGGILSICCVIAFVSLPGPAVSYLAISVAGAIAHNIGQLAALAFMLKTVAVMYYLPVLLISGVLLGGITGTVLRIILPAIERIK